MEELHHKSQQNNILKKEISEIYSEIRKKCSTFCFLCILKTIAMLRKQAYQKMVDEHSSKIAWLLYWDVEVDEHMENISSYHLTFFDKLVLCRSLQFSIPEPCILPLTSRQLLRKHFWNLNPSFPTTKKS